MQHQDKLIIEDLGFRDGMNYSISKDITLPSDYIIYFEKDKDVALNLYIKKNYDDIKSSFNKLDYNFIYVPNLIQEVENLQVLLEYFLPQLSTSDIPFKTNNDYFQILEELKKITILGIIMPYELNGSNVFDYSYILELLGYEGHLNSGFLVLSPYYKAIGFNPNKSYLRGKDFYEEFEGLYTFIKSISFQNGEASIGNIYKPNKEEIDSLDDDAKQIISEFENKLAFLKDSGQLLLIIPILKNLIDSQSEKIDFKSISKVIIDNQNRIYLPYFKKEVELSHLTKSIYFLFLKHPEGIDLNELSIYKNELLSIYKSVSNQLDFDKMSKSIDDVINIESKAIYTHISRVKSAFYKIMDISFAKYYVISGSGEEKRKVLFNTFSIEWRNFNLKDESEIF
jgi:hypothetical protein